MFVIKTILSVPVTFIYAFEDLLCVSYYNITSFITTSAAPSPNPGTSYLASLGFNWQCVSYGFLSPHMSISVPKNVNKLSLPFYTYAYSVSFQNIISEVVVIP